MECRIYAKAFTLEAAAELAKIDFREEFDLYGVECQGNGIDYYDTECDRFEALRILGRISEALNGEGISWTTYALEDDYCFAYTFYNLGDGIKAAFFGSDDITFDVSNSECLYAALSLFNDEELSELYRELAGEEASDRFLRGDKREELINLLTTNGELRWNEDTLTLGPYQKKLREVIIHNFDNNSYENTDGFDPEPCWEIRKIACFSEIEKNNLIRTKGRDDQSIESSAGEDLFVIEGDKLIKYTGNESTVIIPEGITCIGEDAFEENDSVEEIIIPDGVMCLGAGAFAGCESLKRVVLPEGLKEIEGYVFTGCTGLREVDLPDSVISIGEELFCESGITSIQMPKSIDTIPACMYQGCSNLVNIVIPDHITDIGEWAFSSCENLEVVRLPDGMKVIEEGAFSGCTNLATVRIPESVTEIGDGIFDSCDSAVVNVRKGSFAEEYCVSTQIQYVYSDA